MAYLQGTATDYADLMARLRTFAETTLGYVAVKTAVDEVIWKASGISADKEIFFGVKRYFDISLDYYNWKIGSFIGCVPSNVFENQPGVYITGIALTNNAIPFTFVGNGQRLFIIADVNNHVMSAYMGFFNKYAPFSQWPYPIVNGGNFYPAGAIRFDNTNIISSWKGYGIPESGTGSPSNLAIRMQDGSWRNPQAMPYYCTTDVYRTTHSDSTQADGYLGITPIELTDNRGGNVNIYGSLDGLFFISGFGNNHGNTITIGADTYYIIRDVYRTGFKDYAAVKLA